jgi:hypothetical protein
MQTLVNLDASSVLEAQFPSSDVEMFSRNMIGHVEMHRSVDEYTSAVKSSLTLSLAKKKKKKN